MQERFFPTSAALRKWLATNHDKENELWVGLHKKGSGMRSITWPELVDELLCFGWIDGVRRTVNESSYSIRVTPRRERSIWSKVNTRRAKELMELGLMEPVGIAAFSRRDEARSGAYSFERDEAKLTEGDEDEFRSKEAAWRFFQSQPPSYRRAALRWVVSAKREETRRRRLVNLIEDSERGERIGPLRPRR
ncbi:MAG: YdeI/OmpD-associated family protein [Gemmatimonadota bacterium]